MFIGRMSVGTVTKNSELFCGLFDMTKLKGGERIRTLYGMEEIENEA